MLMKFSTASMSKARPAGIIAESSKHPPPAFLGSISIQRKDKIWSTATHI